MVSLPVTDNIENKKPIAVEEKEPQEVFIFILRLFGGIC